MAQIIAEVKGLVARVTDLSEKEAERNEKMSQILTRVEGIEARMTELEGAAAAAGDGAAPGARTGKSAGGSKSIANEHPLLKVCHDAMLHVHLC